MYSFEKQRGYVQRDTDEVKGRALVKALTGARLARAETARVPNIVVVYGSQDQCEYSSIELQR
jgi:hypothetical protein